MIIIPSGNYTRLFSDYIHYIYPQCKYLSIMIYPEHIAFIANPTDNNISSTLQLESSWFHTYKYNSIPNHYIKIHLKTLYSLLSNIYENHSIFIDILSNHTIHIEMKNIDTELSVVKSCIIPYTIINHTDISLDSYIEHSNTIQLSPLHLYNICKQLYLSNSYISIHSDNNSIVFKSCSIDDENTDSDSDENYNNHHQLQVLNTDLRIEIPIHTLHNYHYNHDVYNNIYNATHMIQSLNIPYSTMFTHFSLFISHNKSINLFYYINNSNSIVDMDTSSSYNSPYTHNNFIHIQLFPIHNYD